MPEIFRYSDTDRKLAVFWSLTESITELIDLLSPSDEDMEILRNIPLEKRRKEWLSTRILLRIAAPGKPLNWLPSGKPVLDGKTHISFSHSDQLAGIMVAAEPCGLDIQRPTDKLLRIKTRFCNAREMTNAPSETDLDYFTTIWCAKEAIFKCFGERVIFAEDIMIRPFQPESEYLEATYSGHHGQRVFNLRRFVLDSCRIVITL